MPVLRSDKDPENLTLTFVAEFEAPQERVWQIWEDPRQLERWWGPPTWPATFEQHDLRPGGSSKYYMTGPAGEKAGGWWRIVSVDKPNSLEFEDGFSDERGEPAEGMPTTRGTVTFEEVDGRTRMTTISRFASLEQLEQLSQMGMEEGMREAMGQIDALLAESRV
ncbi:SRPBCC domain-containing protein [Naasia sp. SYSU D00948]|uniref:SRPBCC family protein n=1 Tax=Naasia sp. SYSU D00948 TaxID=2817379 RepID=UPI001B30973D|nr:SRPBCC domain-containing protein [Naasia sp. SYSU D00948]